MMVDSRKVYSSVHDAVSDGRMNHYFILNAPGSGVYVVYFLKHEGEPVQMMILNSLADAIDSAQNLEWSMTDDA